MLAYLCVTNIPTMTTLIRNIGQLAGIYPQGHPVIKGADMAQYPSTENAYLLLDDDRIKAFGPMSEAPVQADDVVDAHGRFIIPSFVDSHTHLVWAGSREGEFVDRIKGLSYEEIGKRGGGILNSAKRLQATSEDELFDQAWNRLQEVIGFGTGAIEIKSGYGLTVEAELKMLRVIQRLREASPIPVKATFLGAHAYPTAFKNNHQGYLDLIINEMLPAIAKEGLADYVDAFLERNYFSLEETLQVIDAAAKYGLKPKVHVNQFSSIGGVQACVDRGAISVDHLEEMAEVDYEALANSHTLPVVLPTCSFFIKIPYAPARTMIDRGLPVVIATDYNPGSTPGGKLPFALSLACIQMGLLPEEAFNAAGLNAAYALELQDEVGSIGIGKKANFLITNAIPTLAFIPYAFSSDHIDEVWVNGRKWSPA